MKFISEREELEAQALRMINEACGAIPQECADNQPPSMDKLKEGIQLLNKARRLGHTVQCMQCRDNFDRAKKDHLILITSHIYDSSGKKIDIPPGDFQRLVMCKKCADKSKLYQYLAQR